MIWNPETYFEEMSAYERVRGAHVGSWYRNQSEDELRQRLQWLKDCLSCEEHSPNSEHSGSIPDNNGNPIYWQLSKCKCGAYRHRSQRSWNDMPSDNREKFEDEVFLLSRYFAEQGGIYEI